MGKTTGRDSELTQAHPQDGYPAADFKLEVELGTTGGWPPGPVPVVLASSTQSLTEHGLSHVAAAALEPAWYLTSSATVDS